MSNITWPDKDETTAAPWYAECFRTALRRIGVMLNSEQATALCKDVNLEIDDGSIDEIFEKNKWDRQIIQFNIIEEDPHTLDDEYRAEYFFYCNVAFPSRRGLSIAKFAVPKPFLKWGYKHLFRPDGTVKELETEKFGGGIDSPAFVLHCATNYLVKNFWHNFVHRKIQGITDDNYAVFRGPAREVSDFEADNLANILLVRSYGLPIRTKGRLSENTSRQIRALFRRNRCNFIFAERARHRQSDRSSMSREERWHELEWRFRRNVANVVSMQLIAAGLCAPSLRVFFSGQINSSFDQAKESFKTWRTGHVIVEISGKRINSNCAPYLPDDELRKDLYKFALSEKRITTTHTLRVRREREIAARVLVDYRHYIESDGNFRESIAQTMNALALRMGVACLNGSGRSI